MARLIVFMGKPPREGYKERSYRFDGRGESQPRSFPMTALVELLHPTHVDFLCTADEEVKTQFELCRGEIVGAGLLQEDCIQSVTVAPPGDLEGFRQLAGQLASAVPPGEEVYLDVTFGFRATSVAVLLSAGLLRALGTMRVARLTYVNMEGAGDGAPAAIVDLTEMLALQDLAALLREIRNGRFERFVLEASDALPVMVSGAFSQRLRQLAKDFEGIRIDRLTSKTGVDRFRGLITEMQNWAAKHSALRLPVEEARRVIEPLTNPSNRGHGGRLHQLAQWFLDRGRLERAIITCYEGTGWLCAEKLLEGRLPAPQPGRSHPTRDEIVGAASGRLTGQNSALGALSHIADEGRKMRNSVAHGGLLTGGSPQEVTEDRVKTLLRHFKTFAETVDQVTAPR